MQLTIAARISEFGFSASKVAALGENVILLVNLAWSAWLYAQFLRGRRSFGTLQRWQTAYLGVYAAWAALVVVLFPPLFGFVQGLPAYRIAFTSAYAWRTNRSPVVPGC